MFLRGLIPHGCLSPSQGHGIFLLRPGLHVHGLMPLGDHLYRWSQGVGPGGMVLQGVRPSGNLMGNIAFENGHL